MTANYLPRPITNDTDEFERDFEALLERLLVLKFDGQIPRKAADEDDGSFHKLNCAPCMARWLLGMNTDSGEDNSARLEAAQLSVTEAERLLENARQRVVDIEREMGIAGAVAAQNDDHDAVLAALVEAQELEAEERDLLAEFADFDTLDDRLEGFQMKDALRFTPVLSHEREEKDS